MSEDDTDRKHQVAVLREIAARIEEGAAPPMSDDVFDALSREFSDRISVASAAKLRTQLATRESELDGRTASRLRAQLGAREEHERDAVEPARRPTPDHRQR